MKPSVMANANASASAGGGGPTNNATTATNGMNIPINHEFSSSQYHQPGAGGYYGDGVNSGAYGSPRQYAQQQQQQPAQQQQHPQQYQQHPQHTQQNPAHYQQGFGFEPDMDMDMDMDMFPRGRMGRMHDPFAGFGNSHFGFPQFGSLGRRRQHTTADPMADDNDFFNRLPSEFRQYIPDSFGHRRAGSGQVPTQQQQHHPQQQHHQQQQMPPQAQYYQNYSNTPPHNNGNNNGAVPQSPSKKLCDAAIQTEDPITAGYSEVDSVGPMQMENLQQHGLRNTVDMGVKSAAEGENHGPRSHSAPPTEQQQQQQQQQQQIPVNGKRPTPPPQQQQQPQYAANQQFATQTSPQVQPGTAQQPPQFQKAYYAPHPQPHPQQKQQTPPPPQTPGGSYVRTIPIFVEGRSEPIINAHKEIPNQNSASAGPTATANASARVYVPQQQQQPQQQHRPTPLNTQQQQQQQQEFAAGPATGLPPQTPHTLDSINKIQDIQRDVLDLMGKVENFTGKRQDKEYAYLDEMLTRNLLKLDTIDTNGKDSIRLARKEAIKCIQASINVLEAKAEENAKTAQAAEAGAGNNEVAPDEAAAALATRKSTSKEQVTKEAGTDSGTAADTNTPEPQPCDATKIQEPIPLPPPEGMQIDEQQQTLEIAAQKSQNEASPAAQAGDEEQTATTSESSETKTTMETK